MVSSHEWVLVWSVKIWLNLKMVRINLRMVNINDILLGLVLLKELEIALSLVIQGPQQLLDVLYVIEAFHYSSATNRHRNYN
jgi:hypothetical protein